MREALPRAAFVLTAFAVCARGAQSPGEVSSLRLGAALPVAAGHTVAEALRAPFPDAYTVEAGPVGARVRHAVRSCADFLPLAAERPTTGSSLNDRTLGALGADCVALSWIGEAGLADTPAPPIARRAGLGTLLVRQLPPELALALSGDEQRAVEEASRAAKSLLAVEPEAKLTLRPAGTALLATPEWREHLALYARGSFAKAGGDSAGGGDELLLRVTAEAIGGTYTSTRLFLLRAAHGGWVVMRSYPAATLPVGK